MPQTAKTKTPYPRGPEGLLFDTMHPERNNHRPDLSPDAYHCVVRALGYLKGDRSNTFPSTHEGVIQPFGVNF